MPLNTHEEFRQLCALATSGGLTAEEQERLETHLMECDGCRRALREYDRVARIGMPSLAEDFPEGRFSGGLADDADDWSEEAACQEFFERLDSAGEGNFAGRDRQNGSVVPGIGVPSLKGKVWWPAAGALPYAAAIFFAAGMGWFGYRAGMERAASVARVVNQTPAIRAGVTADLATLSAINISKERQSSDRQSLDGQSLGIEVEERNREIARLTDKVARQTAENDLDALQKQRSGDAAHEADVEARLAKFADQLKERDANIDDQRDLLAHDKDIRDLMGARELYVAEVSDVGGNGKTKKPFGRVFYTKGKSLIFYAYDLDQQPGLRDASTFQAWGRRGPELSRSVNLGIFYADNAAHKRWVLKFNDATSLEQIDAAFVTVEPKGGSQKPTGKQFLFTYLRVEPNHP
jgi:hypothetical protein